MKNYILSNLDNLIGWPEYALNFLFESHGWEAVSCFNDHKCAWINKDINKSVIAKFDFIDNAEMKNTCIHSIWSINGIYDDKIKNCPENILEDIKNEFDKL